MRNPAIDTLRGLSIALVVIHHVALRIPLRDTALVEVLPRKLLSALAYNGYEGVFVFFVVSGFLITTQSLQRWGRLRDIDLADFYVRRAARILPLLLLLIAVLCALHALGLPRYVIDGEGQSLGATVLSALGLYLNWYEGQTGWLPGNWDVLWSLSIEEVFYLAFPLACLWVRDLRVLVAALALLALSLPSTRAALAHNGIWQEKAYLPGMAAIATGVLAALAAQRWRVSRPMAHALSWLGALALAATLLFANELWSRMADGMMLVLTGSVALVLFGLHAKQRHGIVRPWPGLGVLRAMGRWSYEIYLVHMFVVFTVVDLFKSSGADVRHGHWWHLAVLALCLLLGAAVTRFVSTPAERAVRAAWERRRAASGRLELAGPN